MSTATFQELTDLAQLYPCPMCHANGWCRTTSGKPASALHQARRYPVDMAYGQGYVDGLQDERSYPRRGD